MLLPHNEKKKRQNMKRIILYSNSKPVFHPQYIFSHTQQFHRYTPNLISHFLQPLIEKSRFTQQISWGKLCPKLFPFLLLSYLTVTHVVTAAQGPQPTLIMATNGITLFIYFFNSGKPPSSLAMTLLSGNFPLLF